MELGGEVEYSEFIHEDTFTVADAAVTVSSGQNTAMQVHQALQKPEMIVAVWQAGMALREQQEMDEPTVLVAMRQMSTVWANLFPIEQSRIMRLLIERVQLHEDGLNIIWRDDSWQRFSSELKGHQFVVEQHAPAELEEVE